MMPRSPGAVGALLIAALLAPAAAFAQAQPTLSPDEEIAPRQVQVVPAPKPKPKAKPAPRAAQPADNPADAPAPAASAAPTMVPAPPPKPKKPATPANVVACSGAFAKDSSHVKLAAFVQTGNIEYGKVSGAGNSELGATILYPKDPKRRLEVLWQNEATRSGTSLIVITRRSQWKGPKGLHLGLAIAALQKINGKPFKLAGFDQPDGARAIDWMGGALASLPGGCQIGIKLDADRKVAADLVAAAAGKEFLSDSPAIRAVKPTVSEIVIGYP